MTLEFGQTYVESGYTAADCKDVNLTSSVKVTNNVNIWVAGIYAVTYEVTDSTGLSARVVRTVNVKPEPKEAVPATAPKITVNGSDPIVLHLTSKTPYTEQKARAVDFDGTDISDLVVVSGTVNRNAAATYTLTYSVTSPKSGLQSTATRNVRIIAPAEKSEPRVKYGLSAQAKQGGIVTHTGIVCNEMGFMDLQVADIDKNMTITVKLVDTATKKTMMTDTFTAAGSKQYNILNGKYELVVGVIKANGNSKYELNLLMPEVTQPFFVEEEIPLELSFVRIAPIGSNPIILHLGGTSYFEQGARAVDFKGEDLTHAVEIIGEPDITVPGSYTVTYRIFDEIIQRYAETTREVRILAPDEEGLFEFDEIPLLPNEIIFEETPLATNYIVKAGDWLERIARNLFNKASRWRDIYEFNKDVIGSDPNLIFIGQEFKLKTEWYE